MRCGSNARDDPSAPLLVGYLRKVRTRLVHPFAVRNEGDASERPNLRSGRVTIACWGRYESRLSAERLAGNIFRDAMNAEPPVDGRAGGQFPTTRWSVIASARAGNERGLERLCEGYHLPVLAFFKEAGFSEHDAKDLTQSFFADILRRNYLKNYSRGEARFRTFLIHSLKHHLCDQLDKANALKRGGGRMTVSIHEEDALGQPRIQPRDPSPNPEQVFVREWVSTLVAKAFAQVERECDRSARRALLTELEPVLHRDQDAPSYREIARRLGSTEGAVKAAAKRIRDRLQWLIRDQIKRTLRDESECDAEIRDLIGFFGQSIYPGPPASECRRPPGTEAASTG